MILSGIFYAHKYQVYLPSRIIDRVNSQKVIEIEADFGSLEYEGLVLRVKRSEII